MAAVSSQMHYLEDELRRLVAEDHKIFDFLQNAILDGLWYWDLEHPEQEWMNGDFWRLLGYDPAARAHLASEWQDLIHPDDLAEAIENLQAHCADPDHAYDQVVRYRHRDGSTVWVRCRGMAVRNADGKAVRMIGAHTDVTQLMRTQELLKTAQQAAETECANAQAANAQKSQFLANMSHELRTPLNAIIGFAELMQYQLANGQTPPKLDDYVKSIADAGHGLLDLINDLLDLSKIEAGKTSLVNEAFSIQAELVQLHSYVDMKAKTKNIDLLYEGPIPDFYVFGDRCRFRQVLLNLIDNAIKFSPGGTILIASEYEQKGNTVELSVTIKDNGCGIRRERLDVIFEPFQQADHKISREVGGTGLGLAISRQNCRLMGGDITVKSTLGEGSAFQARFVFSSTADRLSDQAARS